MTYVKASQKEVAQTIKRHPREKINCLTDFIFKWHAFLGRVIFLWIQYVYPSFLKGFSLF